MHEQFNLELERLGDKVREELKKFKSSGHAFLLFDSPYTCSEVTQYLK